MVSDISNFKFMATKCPFRAGLGHLENTQVPLKNGLNGIENAERALRATKKALLYI